MEKQTSKFNDENCDFTIKVGVEPFGVHRDVLASSSNYFRARFEDDKFCEVKDVSDKSVKQCIGFMYGEELKLNKKNVVEILQVAHKWQLGQAIEKCVEFLSQGIDMNSCIEVMKLSRRYNYDKLGKACTDFIAENTEQIVKSGTYKSLDTNYFMQLLQHEETKKIPAIKLWSICVEWRDNNRKILSESDFCIIIAEFPGRDFSVSEFKAHVCSNDHFSSCDTCASQLSRYLLESIGAGDIKPDVKTCLFAKKIAKKYNHVVAGEKIDAFIIKNHSRVFLDPDFISIEKEDLFFYVKKVMDKLNARDFSKIINWLTSSEERRDVFPKFFRKKFKFAAFFGSSKPVSGTAPGTLLFDVLSPSNCLIIKEMSKKYQCTDAELWVDNYIVEKFDLVSKENDFNKLELIDVVKYLSEATRQEGSVLWGAVTKWIEFDENNRKKNFFQLFDALDFKQFSVCSLRASVCTYQLVKNSVECMNRLLEIIFLKIETHDVDIATIKHNLKKEKK